MITLLSSRWWLFVLRGALAITFGVLFIVSPLKTLLFFIIVWGLYLLIEGITLVIVSLLKSREIEKWGLLLAQGIVHMLFSVFLFLIPVATLKIVVFITAVWFIVEGILQIVMAIRIRKQIPNEWLIAVSGALSLFVGILLLAFPITTVTIYCVLFGIASVLWGILLMVFGFKLKALQKQLKKLPSQELLVFSDF